MTQGKILKKIRENLSISKRYAHIIYIYIFFSKEFLLNATEKISLLAQAFTKIYTLHLQGMEVELL